MVGEFKKRQSQYSGGRYRSPKVFSGAKIKVRKELKLSPALIKGVIALLIVIFLSYFFLFSSKFQIRDIMIEGNTLVSAEEIIQSLPQNQNVFRIDIDKTKTFLLGNFPEIKQVEVFRGIPNALKIVIIEREGKMVWQSGDSKYLVSSQGEVAKQITGEEGKDLPVVIDRKNLPVATGKTLVSPNFVAFITNVYSQFFEVENIQPTIFEINETTFDVNLYTDAGFYVKLNSLRSSKKQLENLKQVLVAKRAEIREYVDLRIDGWAYYK